MDLADRRGDREFSALVWLKAALCGGGCGGGGGGDSGGGVKLVETVVVVDVIVISLFFPSSADPPSLTRAPSPYPSIFKTPSRPSSDERTTDTKRDRSARRRADVLPDLTEAGIEVTDTSTTDVQEGQAERTATEDSRTGTESAGEQDAKRTDGQSKD